MNEHPTPGANAEQFEYWNGPEGQYWVDREDRFDAMLTPFVDPILDAAAVSTGDRVLDVGCGNGALARAAARRGAVVTGVDISEPMLQRARERAEADGLDIAFELADAQVHAFPEFDAVISRFGCMFFADPGAAFVNLAAALRPGGRLAFVCWQDAMANEWVAVPAGAVIPIVGVPDEVPPGAPGPFAFADAERVGGFVAGAGFSDVAVEPLTPLVCLGGAADLDDAVGWISQSGIGKRFLGEADATTTARALDAVRAALEPFVTNDGVCLRSATWLVRAVR